MMRLTYALMALAVFQVGLAVYTGNVSATFGWAVVITQCFTIKYAKQQIAILEKRR